MTDSKQVTFDKVPFRLNLTILLAVGIAFGTGIAYATKLVTTIEAMDVRLTAMGSAVDRMSGLLAADGRALAVLQARCDGLDARLRLIEQKAK